MQLFPTPMVARDVHNEADFPAKGTLSGSAEFRGETLVGGVLVCGGLSQRMGRDKALLELEGRSLLERAAEALAQVCSVVVLACGDRPRYAELGLALALDSIERAGPSAGVVAGMEALDTERALVIACDMPRLSPAIFRALIARSHRDDLDVCFLSSERGPEPLCAVYSRRCLPAMKRCLERGLRRVTAFLEEPLCSDSSSELAQAAHKLRVGRLDVSELDAPVRDASLVTNLNTPDELERERRGEERR